MEAVSCPFLFVLFCCISDLKTFNLDGVKFLGLLMQLVVNFSSERFAQPETLLSTLLFTLYLCCYGNGCHSFLWL